MKRYRIKNHWKMKENVLIKPDVFTVAIAALLYLSFGVLLTMGGVLWVRSELKAFFDISYAGYGMLLLVILLVSELWALFIQIPSIQGYDAIAESWVNRVRLFFGALILLLFMILSIVFFSSPQNGAFRLWLAKMVYKLSDYSQNNYVERLAMIDEVIDRGGSNAEQFAERGRLYLEIAMIKTDRTEEYKYSLPDDTSEECYQIAINNFDDAIAQDDEVAEYYYLRGKAKYHDRVSPYSAAKDDLQKAIELNDAVPDYHFYCARAWYGMSTNSTDHTDSDEAIQNALDYINSAIKKYRKEEAGNPDEKLEKESESDLKVALNDASDVGLVNVKQDKILAEYYYYAGLIHVFQDDYDKNLTEDIKNYQHAVSYDPGNAEYFSQLGISYYKRDDLTNAEGAFDSAISIDKANSDYYNEGYHLAWKAHAVEKDKARVQEAIEVYEDSLKFRPDYAYSYRRLAELYKEQNDTASAENIYGRAITYCKDNAEFYYARGTMYYARGIMYYDKADFDCTIEDMEKAIEGGSSDKANAYWYIGSSYYMLENYNTAYEYYQRAKDHGGCEMEIDKYMNVCLKYMKEE